MSSREIGIRAKILNPTHGTNLQAQGNEPSGRPGVWPAGIPPFSNGGPMMGWSPYSSKAYGKESLGWGAFSPWDHSILPLGFSCDSVTWRHSCKMPPADSYASYGLPSPFFP